MKSFNLHPFLYENLEGKIKMQKKVVVFNNLVEERLKALNEQFEVEVISPVPPLTDPHLQAALKEADAIVGTGFQVTEDLLDLAPKLKIVSTVSVGYNHLNVDLLSERGILASHTPGVLDDTVADVIFGLALASARRMTELDRFVKNKEWTRFMREEHYGVDVHHKTIGIIGMGRIGEKIAQRAHFGFDMDVLYYNRSRKEAAEQTYNATYTPLEDLLKQSDFVVLMTPLTPETEGMIHADHFAMMKKSAIFINGSRGKTIVEADLIQALKNKEILAAGLDVYEEEPVQADNPLLEMDNVVTLPHIGSATAETEDKMEALAVDNVIAALTGKKPPTLVDESIWQA